MQALSSALVAGGLWFWSASNEGTTITPSSDGGGWVNDVSWCVGVLMMHDVSTAKRASTREKGRATTLVELREEKNIELREEKTFELRGI